MEHLKKEFITPQLDVDVFETEDVITISSGLSNMGTGSDVESKFGFNDPLYGIKDIFGGI
jgi:hypothetical protein